MNTKCPAGQYWDSLIKKCLQCNVMCQQPLVITKCTKYCLLADCKTLPGHYYDGLLRKCVKCADICGRHPAECFQHCNTPVTKKLPVQVTSHHLNASGLSEQTTLEDSTIFLYALLALCMLLVLSSLLLALVVFLRRRRAQTNPNQATVRQGRADAQRRGQLGSNAKDFMATEPSDESSPTETCVCVHCYPDPTTVGGNNKAPSRAPGTYDQQAVLHHALMLNQCPLWAQNASHTSTLEEYDESMVG
ncbi:tumor necrosis factor receptor superfamily member 13B [Vanacampus margaritifer]